MLENAQLMVRDKPDAIVIYPVSSATQGVGKILGDSKIPCVSVNADTAACRFLNIDNRALGKAPRRSSVTSPSNVAGTPRTRRY
jgi:ABC-type sugar transport system substrate-binding protein